MDEIERYIGFRKKWVEIFSPLTDAELMAAAGALHILVGEDTGRIDNFVEGAFILPRILIHTIVVHHCVIHHDG